jgi:hypothetical protein
MHRLSRRTVLAAAPAAAVGTLLLHPTRPPAARADAAAAPSPTLDDRYPAQEAAAVREVVGASHFSLERVRALVDGRPELANSTWDWGWGDWETALGAASHTGNREIAVYLIDHGARPDLFTAAMMGNLPAVRALIEATPGLRRLAGPHGIPLRRHAELGGEPARAVLDYLDALGGADAGPADLPLPIERQAYAGTFAFGERPEDRFEIAVGANDKLTIQRADGTPRTLFHQGDHAFHPAGAPSARIRFRVEGGAVRALEIHNPGLILSARRAGGGPVVGSEAR